jgi:hypothetical protein
MNLVKGQRQIQKRPPKKQKQAGATDSKAKNNYKTCVLRALRWA